MTLDEVTALFELIALVMICLPMASQPGYQPPAAASAVGAVVLELRSLTAASMGS